MERFREEVEQVRAALGLDQFYLYGHSWGTMLAIEHALKYQRHLKALVISNRVSDAGREHRENLYRRNKRMNQPRR